MKKISIRYLLFVAVATLFMIGCTSDKTISLDDAHALWKARSTAGADEATKWNRVYFALDDGMGGHQWKFEVLRTNEGYYYSTDLENYRKLKDSDVKKLDDIFTRHEILALADYESDTFILDGGSYYYLFEMDDGNRISQEGFSNDIKDETDFLKAIDDLFKFGIFVK